MERRARREPVSRILGRKGLWKIALHVTPDVLTPRPDTEVIYKVTDRYDRDSERGVVWNDPDLALPWPVAEAEAVLSAKDRALPRWADLPALF